MHKTTSILLASLASLATTHGVIVYDVFEYSLGTSLSVSLTGSIAETLEQTQPVDRFPAEWGSLISVHVEYLTASGTWTFSSGGGFGGGDAGQIINGPLVTIREVDTLGTFVGSGTPGSGLFSISSTDSIITGGALDVDHLVGENVNFIGSISNWLTNSSVDMEWYALLIPHVKNVSPATDGASFSAAFEGTARIAYTFNASQTYFDEGSPVFVPQSTTLPEPAFASALLGTFAFMLQRRR